MAQHETAIKSFQSRDTLALVTSTSPTSRRVDFKLPILSKGGLLHAIRVMASSVVRLSGTLGEKLINQYDFYSAFTASDEFESLPRGEAWAHCLSNAF
jgi:hypothetical protein